MKRTFYQILFLVICALPAWATTQVSPEICGNGIDDPLQTGGSANGTKGSCPGGYMDARIGNGCDKICPGADQDGDGYADSVDCDPTNRDVYPGVWTGDK